jgi:YggT family protein
MLAPFVELLLNVIFIVNLLLGIWIILGLLIHFDIVNRTSPIVNNIYTTLSRLLEPLLRPIRNLIEKYLTHFGGIDLSPIILWLLLDFLRSALIHWTNVSPLMTTTVQ